MDSTSAELVKMAENYFLALKVTFANELRAICDKAGVNYHIVREGWLDDPRIGLSHSASFKENRGYGGKCLPKDTAALRQMCQSLGFTPHLLLGMIEANDSAGRE